MSVPWNTSQLKDYPGWLICSPTLRTLLACKFWPESLIGLHIEVLHVGRNSVWFLTGIVVIRFLVCFMPKRTLQTLVLLQRVCSAVDSFCTWFNSSRCKSHDYTQRTVSKLCTTSIWKLSQLYLRRDNIITFRAFAQSGKRASVVNSGIFKGRWSISPLFG